MRSARGALFIDSLEDVRVFALINEAGKAGEIAFCSPRRGAGRITVEAIDETTFDVGIGALSILIGPQAYAALLEDENSDVMSLALGTELRLLLNRRLGLAVSGQAFYGPDILTFGSADSLTDLSARVEMNVAPRLTAFGGMRWFEFDLAEGGGKRTLQEELFVGAGYRF